MPGFVARPEWYPEMKRYGILPEDWSPSRPVDVYATESVTGNRSGPSPKVISPKPAERSPWNGNQTRLLGRDELLWFTDSVGNTQLREDVSPRIAQITRIGKCSASRCHLCHSPQ